MSEKYYHIEEVSNRTGLTKRAIRYYEDIELIKPVRTEASYRLYTEDDINLIIRIRELRDALGFSLAEVKEIFDLELNLKKIFRGDTKDKTLIENSMIVISKQINLIEEKEKTLAKAKDKYKEVLTKLEALSQSKDL